MLIRSNTGTKLFATDSEVQFLRRISGMRGAFSSSFKTKSSRVLGTLPKTCEGTVRVFGVWASRAKARHGHHR